MKYLKNLILISITVFIVGCGISDTAKKELTVLDNNLKLLSNIYNSNIKFLEKLKNEDIYEQIKDIEKSEEWTKKLVLINKDILKLKEKYKKIANAIEEAGIYAWFSSQPELKIRREIFISNNQAIIIKKDIDAISDRIKEILKLAKNSKNIKLKYYKNIDTTILKIDNFITFAKKYIIKYPNKTEDINYKINLLKNYKIKLLKLKDKIMNETKILNLDKLLKEIDSYINLSIKNVDFFTKKLKELDVSYSKILKNQKIEYFVQIGMTSWDNDSDFNTEKNRLFNPVKIDRYTYNYLKTKFNSKIGHYGCFISCSIKADIDKKIFNKLRIPNKIKLPSFHDSAEFWINELYFETYHKYLIIKNGKKQKTDWIEVPFEYYQKYYNAINKEIVSKPYGYYEEEAILIPSPVGINFVNNPKYGEWRKDSNGHSFWHYYGIYSFLNGNNYNYNRTSYNSYRSYRKKNYKRYTSPTTIANSYNTRVNRSRNKIRGLGSVMRGRGASGGGK